jgi:hypothetical protein
MPRTIDPQLRVMYERANPYTRDIVEVSAPDVGLVLRRWTDQFSVNPPRVSESPGGSSQQSPSGALSLTRSAQVLANMYTDNASEPYKFGLPDTAHIIKGVGWQLADALEPVRLRKFTAKIKSLGTLHNTDFELQIFRMRGIPGRVVRNAGGGITDQIIQYVPTPLLPNPAHVPNPYLIAAPGVTDLVFDLSTYQFDAERRSVPMASLVQPGEVPELIFAIWVTDPVAANAYEWRIDNTSTRSIVGVGTFQEVSWNRANADDPSSLWAPTRPAQVPAFKLEVESYAATSAEVYAITLPRAPSANANTIGRINFQPSKPRGTSATVELSTAGSGGPFTAVKHGDVVSTKQVTYHLRVTLNASSDTHRAPEIAAVGIEFRTTVDISPESTIEVPPQDVNVPFLEGAIGEGQSVVVRPGRRDYRDLISDLLAANATTQLEVDYYIASAHPTITREQWFHVGRWIVSASSPEPTKEVLAILSYIKTLKRKVPQRQEVTNVILTVASATTTQITVSGTLPGPPAADEYDGKTYYIRIRSTAAAGLAVGMLFAVAGNTGTDKLDFTTAMPGTPAASDTIELHSATYQQPKLQWVNADPYDVWWELLTVHRGIPSERIGRGDVGRAGRSGLPPRLADRESVSAQRDKLKVSLTIKDAEPTDRLIDQLSCIMGGSTVDIGGQICFRQIYPILDAAGNTVIPAEAPAAIFDARDYMSLDAPRGVEQRITTMVCSYGVDSALGEDAAPPSTVVYSDADAVDWFTQQDLEELGNSQIPDEIARWCFNTFDGGLYLASTLCRQVVKAASTGLRVWSWTTVDQHPELIVGDRVVLVTDQYVDYDPSTKTSVRGLWAFPLVLVHVGRAGREFRGYMLGLQSAIPIRGGSGGLSDGLVGQPSIGHVEVNAGGELLVTLNQGSPSGAGFRVAASASGMPTDTTVDAAAYRPGTTATVNLGAGWAAGATVQIRAIAYSSDASNAAKSIASTAQKVMAGGGGGNVYTTTPALSLNAAADQVTGSATWGGAAATHNAWVSELGSAFVLKATGLGTPSYVYQSPNDLRTSGGNTNDTIGFYFEAVIGGVVVATSPQGYATYRAAI